MNYINTDALPSFKVVPLSLEIVKAIKSNGQDDFGHEVIEMLATGKGPCRLSLQPFKVGEETRLLFKHSPFDIDNVFNQPGPVFVSKADIEPYVDIYRFPPAIIAEEDIPITLIGYSEAQMMVYTQRLSHEEKQNIDAVIAQVFKENADVAFLHARNSEACCYICKIESV
ncbi:DUF1203 domain-containing protein [uncultured Psychrobacter sp.]|uniref:DUF1203 domain-containing protein n=1 Tax=uncultured Psychrobacter sp. TaxID=259303 RepID=UPI0034599C8D